MKLENYYPTETERLLYIYYGLYIVEKNEDTLKYAPIHIDTDNRKDFPTSVDIDKEMIEWDNAVIFERLSETVSINSYYDIDGISLILKRMEELNFKYCIKNARK